MKIRSLTFVLGAALALALVACKSETGTNVGGAGGLGGAGGEGGGAACQANCASALLDPGGVCSTDAAGATAYENLVSCGASACASECADFTDGTAPSSTCSTCLQSMCSMEFSDCSNDA